MEDGIVFELRSLDPDLISPKHSGAAELRRTKTDFIYDLALSLMIDSLLKEATLLDRHLVVLQCIIEQEPIGIISLSNGTDCPRHKVRTSLRRLEEDGLIEPTNKGAVTTEDTKDIFSALNTQLDESTQQLEEVKRQFKEHTLKP